MYYYLCETEGRQLDPAGVRLAGEEIPEGELEDPFDTAVPETEAPLAHQSMVSLPELAYPPRLRGADIEKLCICSRGMVILQSRPETVWDTVKKQLALHVYLPVTGLMAYLFIVGRLDF